MPSLNQYDCIIIGGGPAGLTAAIYLGRYRRKTLIIDNNASRASYIPITHNFPGFPEGISGQELLKKMKSQVSQYPIDTLTGWVNKLEKIADDSFFAEVSGQQYFAKKLLLATGVEDEKIPIPDFDKAIASHLVRLCPICDAYEASNQRIAVLLKDSASLSHAIFLRTYSAQIVVVFSQQITLTDSDKELLHQNNIEFHEQPLQNISFADHKVNINLQSGIHLVADILYPMLGIHNRSELAVGLGAKCSDCGDLFTDDHQMTSVAGLYAAGDVVCSINQLSVAIGQAAIAATHIHNHLD